MPDSDYKGLVWAPHGGHPGKCVLNFIFPQISPAYQKWVYSASVCDIYNSQYGYKVHLAQ
ncbi:hypothetical protein NADFUDRAFT_48298 [Nadsonia fulvescens var. elongata DSM 6958]|uniref:Uncharacterized protein n=1 Tax=Nadsonia fulvescens var. elongata DSM 6958 TaxID=857566 RepID=A0A1E3PCY4_9ASCO|nr:hypothetical protein NADFUDRAFT_48298 [Nadsonia fulvescens var. elongata DSM 6958]